MSRYTVANLLRKNRSARATNRDRLAVVFGERSITYDELELRSDRLASALTALGFSSGDRVAVLLANRPEYFEIFFAVAKLGGVVVPVNYLFKAPEVEHLLTDSSAQWAFVEERLWDAIRPVRDQFDDVTFVSLDGAEPKTTVYEDLIESALAGEVHVAVNTDDPLLLQYTSGTTGFPKGATHTHATVMWNALQQVADFRLSEDDVYLCIPALCWAAGLHSFTLAVLWSGGTVVLHPSRAFDPGEVCQTIERHGVTMAVLVPSVLRLMLGHAIEEHDLASLHLVVSGGEPVSVSAIEEFQRRLPSCDLVQGYGMTEFPTVMTFLGGEHAVAKRGSAGRAGITTELRVIDDAGREAEAGVHGEIVVRSPATMVGYHRQPDATASAVVDGWFHTGDRGYLDDDGFLFIAGRSKDLIISGGLNVYPAEVERVIETHPAVREVALVGAPDDRYGEVGVAHVVLERDADVAEGELEALVRRELADFKVPRRIVLRHDPLPRTASGKVQKFALRGGESQSPR